MPLYFAYGSNMDPAQMDSRAPGATVVGPGRLDGFRLEFSIYSSGWDGGVANLEPDEKAHVWGVLWDVSDDDLRALDTYEGHPTFYRREDVTVAGPAGSVEACTYRVAHQKGFVPPTDRYLHRVVSAIRLHGLPPEALDAVDRAANPPRPQLTT
jgi:gamma-glutamylcyclotransferase